MEGWIDGWMDGGTDGGTEGRRDGGTEGRRDGGRERGRGRREGEGEGGRTLPWKIYPLRTPMVPTNRKPGYRKIFCRILYSLLTYGMFTRNIGSIYNEYWNDCFPT